MGAEKRIWLKVLLVVASLLLVPTAALIWLLPSSAPPALVSDSEKPGVPQGSSASFVEPAGKRAAPLPAPMRRQPFRGQVLDTEGRGVVGATVRCAPSPDVDEPASATTADDGRFDLAPGEGGCNAKASHPEYGVSDSVHLNASGENRLALPLPGGIAGSVVDERGLPIATFLVAVESFTAPGEQPDSSAGAHKSVTDASGAFELARLARGRYTLTASAEGRPPTRSDTVEVEAGHTTRGIRIKLLRGIAISGIVTDKESKKPLSGVTVALDGSTNSAANAIEHATSGADGAYSLDGVPASTFSVRFSHAGHRDRIMSFDGTGKSEVKGNAELGSAASGGSLELSNVGAMLGQHGEQVTVGFLIAGGPAEKAGVQLYDRVVSIDGKSVDGMTMDDCVQRLRGPEGSRVTLVIERAGKSLDFTMTRAIVVR